MRKLIFVITGIILGTSAFAHEGSHEYKKQTNVKVEITEDGFKPATIKAHLGENVVLLVTRKTDKTCMKELKNADGTNQVKLPLNKEVEFKMGKLNKTGNIKLLCGMEMTAGVITVM